MSDVQHVIKQIVVMQMCQKKYAVRIHTLMEKLCIDRRVNSNLYEIKVHIK